VKEEKSEKQLKTVEPKNSFFKSESKAEQQPAKLIAKKGLKVSKPKEVWSVKAGDDVSSLSADKIAVLKLNGVI
jgi:hypothetical protein